ncbi:UNVERIFIED_CONTAM: hypothetical protein Scaly_2873100 [Sesamum calycinum]|uniref:Uncharacterized protein n=1 Tax=Sesamum calycinum TaxID=2727403 RepID=A0AAW2L8P2_9LAMI
MTVYPLDSRMRHPDVRAQASIARGLRQDVEKSDRTGMRRLTHMDLEPKRETVRVFVVMSGRNPGPTYIPSSHEVSLMDGTRSCPVDAGPSSYYYGDSGPYDYDELGTVFQISQWANRILPSNHTLRGDYYSTKKLVKDLGLPIEKIHAYPHWKKSPYIVLRYLSLTPRLQRLYSLRATVKHITWHATHQTWEGMIVIHPMPRRESILIGCILILQTSHVMLGWAFEQMMVIPGPSNPKRLIDVYLEPLIEELLQLWHLGVRTYDHATDRAFMMRAALMWTMNDLPTYGMAFGWSTAGVMRCP